MNDVFITYRHFRLVDEYNETLPMGGATIAFFVDLRDPNDRYMVVGTAICSDKDHFCKAYGRELAYARLNDERKCMKMGFNIGETKIALPNEAELNKTTLCQVLLTNIAALYAHDLYAHDWSADENTSSTFAEFCNWCERKGIV